MVGLCVFLVLCAGVGATLEEVLVSSQPLRVSAGIGYPGQEAKVRPLSWRNGGDSGGIGGGRGEDEAKGGSMMDQERSRWISRRKNLDVETPGGSGRMKLRTNREVKDAYGRVGSVEINHEGRGLIEGGRHRNEETPGGSAEIRPGTEKDVKNLERTGWISRGSNGVLEIHGESTRMKARTKRDAKDRISVMGSGEGNQEGSELMNQGRKDVERPDGNARMKAGTTNDVKDSEGSGRRKIDEESVGKQAGTKRVEKDPDSSARSSDEKHDMTDSEEAAKGSMKKDEEGRSIGDEETGRGHMKKMRKSLKKIMPYLLVPGMMALGYAPFILASLKMFVMNAVMINMMAFNAAIFITLRNMVFGPRVGQHVKYYNFGYSHRKKQHHHHS